MFECKHEKTSHDICVLHAPSSYRRRIVKMFAGGERRFEGRQPVCAVCNHPDNSAPGLVNLMPKHQVIGTNFHRSGWPYAYAALRSLHSPSGILLDDFVEQNFCYRDTPLTYDRPWIGIFHHPPNPPAFSNQREWLWKAFETAVWKRSVKHLRLAIALSRHLADWLQRQLGVPVAVVKLPCQVQRRGWTPEAWMANHDKMLVGVGWYLRNTQVLQQTPALPGMAKLRLLPDKAHIHDWDHRVRRHWERNGQRKRLDEVSTVGYVSSSVYDKLLNENVVVTEVFDASANNAVLDCLVRNTPLIVNRHPAVVEYLGPDYPLYFDEPNEICSLTKNIEEAHEHLRHCDKRWLSGNVFAESIQRVISANVDQS